MNTLIVYSAQKSNRLEYVLDWLLKDVLQLGYTLAHNEADLVNHPFFISYGKVFPGALSIPDGGLLRETDIKEQKIAVGEWEGTPTLFNMPGDHSVVPFDIFSAIFFLLSRYEEYYPFTPDKYDRYPATESILYKNGWLQRPILDEWVHAFKLLLHDRFNIISIVPGFSYQPTYDIDIAWSYKHKGLRRNVGGFVRDAAKGKASAISERSQVLGNKAKDPYDSFEWLHELHAQTKSKPIYFILAALNTTPYDKNISPEQPQMQQLIKQLAAEGPVGIHPSYYSDTGDTLKNEKAALEKVISKPLTISRQHYIKLKLPDTYERLMQHGITDDYSMGYGSHLGFRAGTGRSFYWYDLKKETVTTLRIHPFCFMDTTARFEEGLSVQGAFDWLADVQKTLRQCGSQLITVFHNFSLGSDKEWNGWSEAYGAFVRKMS